MAEPLVLRSDGPLARSRSHRVRVARTQQAQIAMAVPKKRQSKMKTRQRKAHWFAKARRQAELALSRAKSVDYNPLEDPKCVLRRAPLRGGRV